LAQRQDHSERRSRWHDRHHRSGFVSFCCVSRCKLGLPCTGHNDGQGNRLAQLAKLRRRRGHRCMFCRGPTVAHSTSRAGLPRSNETPSAAHPASGPEHPFQAAVLAAALFSASCGGVSPTTPPRMRDVARPVPTASARGCRFGGVPWRGWDGARDRLIDDFLVFAPRCCVSVTGSTTNPRFRVVIVSRVAGYGGFPYGTACCTPSQPLAAP